MTSTPDNLTRLCRALYSRDPDRADHIAIAYVTAKILGDAADTIARLREALAEVIMLHDDRSTWPARMRENVVSLCALAGSPSEKEGGADDANRV